MFYRMRRDRILRLVPGNWHGIETIVLPTKAMAARKTAKEGIMKGIRRFRKSSPSPDAVGSVIIAVENRSGSGARFPPA
jgi:hypothetical protein